MSCILIHVKFEGHDGGISSGLKDCEKSEQ